MFHPHPLPERVFPVPYQVDFSVELNGRHLDSTKRRITWKVGFAHPPAIFPHLFDANENYIGDKNNGNNDNDNNNVGTIIAPYNLENTKEGVECRGREHEIILTWSILTGKAHIYVDSKEIIRHEPLEGSIFSTFSSSYHRGFELPNPQFNGRHRIDIRCYARTPLGARDMSVDDRGGKFRQYDLTVDGLSFFSMPQLYELGTDQMWDKISRWGLSSSKPSPLEEASYRGGGTHGDVHASGDYKRTGRVVDEYYFDQAKSKSATSRYGQTISKSEYKAMNPRTESEEERMMRIAMEKSLDDWDKDHGYTKSSNGSPSLHNGAIRSHHPRISEENNNPSGNRQSPSRRVKKQNNGGNNLSAIGEDDNLIDFGVDDASKAISHINISRQHTDSDISVLGDDDATTASFTMNTAWNSGAGQQPQQPPMPMQQQPSTGQIYSNPQPTPYHDPTFRLQYAQQPWSSVGTLGSPTSGAGVPSSDASFAVPPPPTWDDYNDAFGGASVMGGPTVATNPPMTPASYESVGMRSPMAQQQQAQQHGMQQQASSRLLPQWQSQTQMFGASSVGGIPSPAAQVGKGNSYDPFRADPFAS